MVRHVNNEVHIFTMLHLSTQVKIIAIRHIKQYKEMQLQHTYSYQPRQVPQMETKKYSCTKGGFKTCVWLWAQSLLHKTLAIYKNKKMQACQKALHTNCNYKIFYNSALFISLITISEISP